ncbi:F-box/FBD/LRR-repeat protein-like protein, partial [Tanacetum coccineum]
DIRDSYISRSNDGPTFTELLECLPVIETVFVAFEDCVDGRVPRELPTPLFHLKYLSIYYVCFIRREELILAFLTKSSPNLEKLKILDRTDTYMESSSSSSRVECYPGIMLEHLNELEIKEFVDHKTRLDFVKLILARSPVLKKVRIFRHHNHCYSKFQISQILMGYSRASPEVQIIVEDPSC